MSHRRNRKKSTKHRLTTGMPNMTKSKSAPDNRPAVDWPGSIDDKYVEDVRSRLNVIEANSVSDDMIRAFLAANDMKQRHAVEALKKTVEWRKGRQMFWNAYRTQNERFLFLSQIRKCGRGIGSTYGRTKDGRCVFYERLGENFSLPLHREFTETEFMDHLIVWCENLLNCALANCGRSTHLISEIPYYENENKSESNKEEQTIAINAETAETETETIANGTNNNNNDDSNIKHKFARIQVSNNCKFSDVVGIIDWYGMKIEIMQKNRHLLLKCATLLCTHYPHLINRLYHVNMPLNFEEIEKELRSILPVQIFTKSIFLESIETRNKRSEFIKNRSKSSRNVRRSKYNILNRKKKGKSAESAAAEEEKKESVEVSANGGVIEEYASNELLSIISASQLPQRYGGSVANEEVFTFVDPIYTYLVGASSDLEPQPTGYEAYDTESQSEAASWTQHPLRSSERHSVRKPVSRGEHYKWQYMAESDRELLFGLTFEADGFRGKAIKVVVREEVQHKCGYCPMFGDFIVLKNGNLVFQFRNAKGGKRLNLQFKIDCNIFPTSFVNKHLPDYHAEESLLQHKTLNFGGKNQRARAHRTRSNKSPSEVSGSTAISTSPPPFSEQMNLHTNATTISLTQPNNTTKTVALGGGGSSTALHGSSSSKMKRAKSQRHKKSSKKIKKKQKSFKKRAKTPEPPHTPI